MKALILTILISLIYGMVYSTTLSWDYPQDPEVADSTQFEDATALQADITHLEKELHRVINYPKSAFANRLEGEVVLLCTIDIEGKVTDVQILQDIGEGAAHEVAEAIKNMTFSPVTQNGVPRPLKMTIPVVFRLE